MSNAIEVRVPDTGGADAVEVIELLVSPGDSVEEEASLITLESDKASMEIPSPQAGSVLEMHVKIGDKVNEGDLICTLTAGASAPATEAPAAAAPSEVAPAAETPASGGSVTLVVPDIGDSGEVEVIELLVSEGDSVAVEDSIITLESDKASMEVPSTDAGHIVKMLVQVGDKVKEGDPIAELSAGGAAASPAPAAKPEPAPAPAAPAAPVPAAEPKAAAPAPMQSNSPTAKISDGDMRRAHASPSVRRFARELGANLSLIQGTGRKNRILKEDVVKFVKQTMEAAGSAYGGTQQGRSQGGAGIPPIPEVDFSKFGEIERVPMGRISKLSAANLHRAWLNVPHVTHHDEADITEMEDFRKSLKAEGEKRGVRVTGLAFFMKALAATLKQFPKFNSSLTPDGEALFYKKYYHIGIAVDTPNGLVVPVFRDVDKKSIFELAEEMGDISARARAKKLKPAEMQGACMTISSLGGIGGTAFTPIVNAPEVAILGITRARMQPVWNGSEFVPRLMCPLDLSYDHRVIDGADAARFMATYAQTVSDIRRLIL